MFTGQHVIVPTPMSRQRSKKGHSRCPLRPLCHLSVPFLLGSWRHCSDLSPLTTKAASRDILCSQVSKVVFSLFCLNHPDGLSSLQGWFSKCGLGTSSMDFPWELLKEASSRPYARPSESMLWAVGAASCVLTSFPEILTQASVCKSPTQTDHHASLDYVGITWAFLIFSDAPKVAGSAKLIFEIWKTGSGKWVSLLPTPAPEHCWQLINEKDSPKISVHILRQKVFENFLCLRRFSPLLSSGIEKSSISLQLRHCPLFLCLSGQCWPQYSLGYQ
jgi:hypothetical protein